MTKSCELAAAEKFYLYQKVNTLKMPDLALLVAEVQRCTALSRLLAERLVVIENELALIHTVDGDKTTVGRESQISVGDETTVRRESQISVGGPTNAFIPNQIAVGNETNALFQSQISGGNKPNDLLHPQIWAGSQPDGSLHTQIDGSTKADVSFPIPDQPSLAAVLKGGILSHAGTDTAGKVATLIIHLAGQPTGNSQESLIALLEYSKGGLAKLMMNLRKRGLVLRAGVRHYVPGPAAIEAMRQAATKPDAAK